MKPAFKLLMLLILQQLSTSYPVFCQHKSLIRYDSIIKRSGYYEYLFLANLIEVTDLDKIYPRHFRVKLPLSMKWYKNSSLDQFGFFYKKKQCIFIYIDLKQQAKLADTSFVPNTGQVDEFIYKKVSYTWSLKQNNMQKNIPKSNRKNLIIRRGAATILLYNIRPKKFLSFEENVTQFQFL